MMKRILLVMTAIVAIASVATTVSAIDPIEDSRIDLIRSKCVQSQIALQRVLVSDRVTRINRGRVYEDTLKLLAAFNSRATLGTYNVSELVAATSKIEGQVSKFKTTYLDYEQRVNAVIDMKCKDQPAEFYNRLQRTREVRESLRGAIGDIDKTLADYKTELDKLAPAFATAPKTDGEQ